jgi:hypothetical protein
MMKVSDKELAREIAISMTLLEYWNKGTSLTDLKRRDKQYREFFEFMDKREEGLTK